MTDYLQLKRYFPWDVCKIIYVKLDQHTYDLISDGKCHVGYANYACQHGYVELFTYACQYFAMTSHYIIKLAHTCVRYDQAVCLSLINIFVVQGMPLNLYIRACKYGSVDCMEYLGRFVGDVRVVKPFKKVTNTARMFELMCAHVTDHRFLHELFCYSMRNGTDHWMYTEKHGYVPNIRAYELAIVYDRVDVCLRYIRCFDICHHFGHVRYRLPLLKELYNGGVVPACYITVNMLRCDVDVAEWWYGVTKSMYVALRSGLVHLIRMAAWDHPFPQDSIAIVLCGASDRRIESLEYLYGRGHMLTSEHMLLAVMRANFTIIKWLVDHNCPRDIDYVLERARMQHGWDYRMKCLRMLET